MRNLIIFGAPGAGKGTQSKLVAKKFNLKHISTGDLLRKEIKKGTDDGIISKQLIDKGKFVPDEMVIKMVEKRIQKHSDKKEGFIFDGFPRTIHQAEILDELMQKHNWEIDQAIHLMVPIEILTERILERAKKEDRADDNSEVIKERVKQYRSKTEPVLEFYKKQGKYFKIKGEEDIETIFVEICGVIEGFYK
jgi:adenylate kinase